MKTKKFKQDDLSIMEYCDLSSSEESKMRLIANLLLQASDGLASSDAAETGHQIRCFLEKKILLDHLFFGRTAPRDLMSHEQFSSEIAILKKRIFTKSN